MPKVTFVNEKVTVDAKDGEDLRTVARRSGVELYTFPHTIANCLGNGLCGSCAVNVQSGTENCSKKGIRERLAKFASILGLTILSNPEKEIRLACQTRIKGDVKIEARPGINWHGEKFWN